MNNAPFELVENTDEQVIIKNKVKSPLELQDARRKETLDSQLKTLDDVIKSSQESIKSDSHQVSLSHLENLINWCYEHETVMEDLKRKNIDLERIEKQFVIQKNKENINRE